MIHVSKPAQEMVKAYFEDKKIQAVRIFVSSGCGGPQLAMALDDIKPDDAVFNHDGVDYIMESALLEQARPVEVDYVRTGFKIKSQLELGGGCSSCGSEGSCCGS